MVIQGHDTLTVGQKYKLRIWDKNLEEHRNVPALVLEIVTANDFINYCKEENVFDKLKSNHGPNYYRVSID